MIEELKKEQHAARRAGNMQALKDINIKLYKIREELRRELKKQKQFERDQQTSARIYEKLNEAQFQKGAKK